MMLMLDLIVYKVTISFCIDKRTPVNVPNSLFFQKGPNLESVLYNTFYIKQFYFDFDFTISMAREFYAKYRRRF